MYVCAIKVTHIIVCIHNYNYSYNCMFTKIEKTQKNITIFKTKFIQKDLKRIISQTKLMFIILIKFGV